MSDFDEILRLDATAQAELIRRKEIAPIELVNLKFPPKKLHFNG